MRLLLGFLLVTLGCGARSELLGPSSEDAGPAGDPCAPPSVDAVCRASIASAPAGSELWSASFSTDGEKLLGPVAADTKGTTYFVAAESSLYVKTVFALDACGELRFQVDVSEWVAASGYVPQIIVAGGHLLLVGIGSIVALDSDTGKLAWIADLEAFANAGGLGVAPGKVQALGFTAAQSDGTAFSVVANDSDVWIVKVSASGKPSPVAKVANYVSGLGYPLGAQQLVLDALGNVILAGSASAGSGAQVDAFTPAGKSVYATTLPSWGNGRFLAAGADYVTGEYLWLLGPDGTLQNEFTGGGPTFVSWGYPTLIDEAGVLFSVGGRHPIPGVSTMTFDLLGRFAKDGTQEWSTTLSASVVGGPILDDGGRVIAMTETHLTGIQRSDGAVAWERELPPLGETASYFLLQNAAGALVTVIDEQVHAYSSGGTRPPTCAFWPTFRGDPGQRVAPFGT